MKIRRAWEIEVEKLIDADFPEEAAKKVVAYLHDEMLKTYTEQIPINTVVGILPKAISKMEKGQKILHRIAEDLEEAGEDEWLTILSDAIHEYAIALSILRQ